ncbi:MAG: hypothetical protein M3R71_01080 [Actinomycetota bacterium]|nr:hypothetical protein [Actinomycetota bacterium]
MLYAFGFQRIGVVLSDLYFVDPDPTPGNEGAERGVRLEVRLLRRPELQGSIYAAQPIAIDRPVWRADLLETVESAPGSFDRTHHHPAFRGWEPGTRKFEPELFADPVAWVGSQLSDLDTLLSNAEMDSTEADPTDASALRGAVPEILDTLRRLLARVHGGELGQPPSDEPLVSARVSWL